MTVKLDADIVCILLKVYFIIIGLKKLCKSSITPDVDIFNFPGILTLKYFDD